MQREDGNPDTKVISNWIQILNIEIDPTTYVRDVVSHHRFLHSKLNRARGYVIHEDEDVRSFVLATKNTHRFKATLFGGSLNTVALLIRHSMSLLSISVKLRLSSMV